MQEKNGFFFLKTLFFPFFVPLPWFFILQNPIEMAPKIHILLAEDDRGLGIVLKRYLESKDMAITLCANGEEALRSFKEESHNFCVFDVAMPLMDGFALAREVRRINKHVPLVFLTAKKEEKDVLEGFKLGADDYVTKPFSMDELLARIQAVFRRSSYVNTTPTVFQLGSLTFDTPRHLLIKGEEVRKLTSKEADLLLLLCENMNMTLDRGEALKKVWYEDSYFNARSMDVYVTKLRKYLQDDPDVELVNIHGVGFKLLVKQ